MHKQYVLSNSTDMSRFMSGQCAQCRHDEAWRVEEGDSCVLLTRILAENDNTPTEWTEAEDGHPVCASFEGVKP